MRQWKLLMLGIVFAISAIAMLIVYQLALAAGFAILAAPFWLLWTYRRQRDNKIIAQARLERQHAIQAPQIMPPMVSAMPFVPDEYIESLSEAERAHFYANHIRLGHHPETGKGFYVSTLDRQAGTYIVGKPGYGKSALMLNMILQDINSGKPVVVIDPHIDLITDIVRRVPKKKLRKIFLLDMTDEQYPFGANLFAIGKLTTAIAQAQSVDRIMHVFETLFPEINGQQYLPRYLRACILTLLCTPGSNLIDMYSLLTNDGFRQRLLRNVTDQTILSFWQLQYDELAVSARLQRVGPLIGRLESILMGRSIIRNILGQQTTINFREAIEQGHVLLFKLPMRVLPQDASMLGTILVSMLHSAIFSFLDVPFEQRPGLCLYVDEVHNFVTPSFSTFFTEARKQRVSLVIAHQHRSQLPMYLQDSTLTARNVLVFLVTPDDARELAPLFPNAEGAARPTEIETKTVEYLLAHGSNNPFVEAFIEYLRHIQRSPKKNGMIEVTKNHGFRTQGAVNAFLHVPAPDNPLVPDPTPDLNRLFYEAQQTGNADLFIPSGIVFGCSNAYRGFYGDFNWARKDVLLSANIQYPPALVVETANGSLRWTRLPETGQEQLYHFLFFLRQTMAYLAQNPIGKKSTLSTAAVAHQLGELPQRVVYVRSGEAISIIHTDDTPPPVEPDVFAERLALIQQQTRDTYCRPKEEVEAAMNVSNDEPQGNTSRWEVVE